MNRFFQRLRFPNHFLPPRRHRRRTGLSGPPLRLLRWLGRTWQYAPVRRFIQMSCLLVFTYLFLHVSWPYADVFTADILSEKEWLPVESFLWLDPLVGLSTSIAARHWDVALLGMAGILLICIFFPRGFCGYICPLGTLIDTFDWLVGRHFSRIHLKRKRGWVHTKYYLLALILVAAVFGVLLSGYFAAIPVVTRGFLFTLGRLQLGLLRGWHQVGTASWSLQASVFLFAGVLLLGLLGKRFWCRYICPTGAVFSVFNLLRIGERKVEDSCIHCNRCVAVCPFDAIHEDFTTRTSDCTFCQTCGGACPVEAIKFVSRWNDESLKSLDEPPVVPRPLSRRGFLGAAAVGSLSALGIRTSDDTGATRYTGLIRPPGSVPEDDFLDLCIRCGQCFKVCPGPVLHPATLNTGWDALWTPVVVPSHAGCHQDCNFCTQVCPTYAIRPLTLEQKRETKIGLAVVDTRICLPHAGERDCQLCFEECEAAGYHAIEMREIELPMGDIPEGIFSEIELEQMSHIQAPFIDAEACIGCGLCEYRCHATYVKQEAILHLSAIRVVANQALREGVADSG